MGAPTAVVDATVAVFVEAARPGFRVLGLRGGPHGLLDSAVVELDAGVPDEMARRAGSFLGGGRRAFSDTDLTTAVEGRARLGVGSVALIGGNGLAHVS